MIIYLLIYLFLIIITGHQGTDMVLSRDCCLTRAMTNIGEQLSMWQSLMVR